MTLKESFQENEVYKPRWLSYSLTKTTLPILIFLSIINLIRYSYLTYIHMITLKHYINFSAAINASYIFQQIIYLIVAPFLITLNIYTLIICLINRKIDR